jgi:hypothetical protein
MLSLFKSDPSKKLRKQHASLLEKAMQAQRNGNIRGYSDLTREAEDIYQQILTLESESK